MKKTLLLDIDHTLMDGMTSRPYLHEFILRMVDKFNVGFYTAASRVRVTEICRVLLHEFRMDRDVIREIERRSLCHDNCKMIWHYPKSGGVIEIKCLKKASEKLGVPLEDILLLDDAPTWEHPNENQIIQAQGFMEYDVDDDYYLRDLDITEDMFQTNKS